MNTIERAAKEACYAFAIVLFSVLLIGHLLYNASRPARARAPMGPKPASEMHPINIENWIPSAMAWTVRKGREQRAGE
jgi:hypothetical protein